MLKTVQAEPLLKAQNELGEGPLWHSRLGCLFWVDIDAGDLYRAEGDFSACTKTHLAKALGAFGFTADGGFILATDAGFQAWHPGDPEPSLLWNPLPRRPAVRLNDGKVDPWGRFWAGSIDTARAQGALYRLDPDGGRHTVLEGIGISNGLGWSPDRKVMYYTDSHRAAIYRFDVDLETGEIRNQRTFVQLPQDGRGIVPDGLCVDAEGCVWSAQWNGWGVVRYSPEGKALLRVEVPTQRVTSCCFGGAQNDTLFITSARTGLSVEELADQPHAGDLFICPTDTRGQSVNTFGPIPNQKESPCD